MVHYSGVFWLNIAKFEVNLCYRYCSNLFRNLGKKSEFRQYHCRNSTKVGERKRKSGREKILIFGNNITEIPSAHTCCSSGCSKCECTRKTKCVNGIAKIGKKNWQLWQCHCRKQEEKKIVVVEITCEELKKKVLRLQYFYNIFTTNHR